jgi:hypothetical protein
MPWSASPKIPSHGVFSPPASPMSGSMAGKGEVTIIPP